MKIILGITVYFLACAISALLARGLFRRAKSKQLSYSLCAASILISFLVVWHIDLKIPLDESHIRDIHLILGYPEAFFLAVLKYFGFFAIIFCATGRAKNGEEGA